MTDSLSDFGLSERDSRRGWAIGKANAGICQYEGNGNETGEYVGTAFLARDMAHIAELTNADGLIRYWGELEFCPSLLFTDSSQGSRTALHWVLRLQPCSLRKSIV